MYLAIQRAKYLLLVLCLGFASVCQAIGFGDLKLYSYLGEPLYAEIALTGYEGMDSQLLQVNLANAKDFMRAGIERPYFLTSLAFQIVNYDQQLFIVVRTNKPVQVPYLEFLIELSWPGGNLIKEYTILLDPPPSDLSQENRAKGYAQKAEEEARQQSANVNPIQQQIDIQKAKQQKQAIAAELASVVREGNKFSDNTFESDIPQTELLPGVVPEAETITASMEYDKQRAEFEQKMANKPKKPPANTLLQKVVEEVSDFKEVDDQSDISINTILAEEAQTTKAETPTTPVAPSTTTTKPAQQVIADEEPVNFNEVIKRSGQEQTAPAIKPAEPVVTSVQEVPAKKGNYVYLGMILSLLLIAAGVVIAIKRGLLSSILHKRPVENITPEPQEQHEVPLNEHVDDNQLSDAIDEFAAQEEEAEEIVMSSSNNAVQPPDDNATLLQPPAKDLQDDVDLTKFEEEFANIDLDELGMPEHKDVTPPEESTQQVESSITEPSLEQPSAAQQATEIVQTHIETELQPQEQSVEQEASIVSELKLSSENDEAEIPSADTLVPKPAPNIEVPTSDTLVPSQVAKAEVAADDTAATQQDVTGPTLVTDQAETVSGLKLSEEGATLITGSSSHLDNTDTVAMKIKLAKKYIETGDRESAKDLLREVIEIANDEQKLEAKLLLTTLE